MPLALGETQSPFAERLAPHSKQGSNGKDKEGWEELFLTAIMLGMSVTDATSAAGVHITLPYKIRKTNPAFKAAWTEAAETGTDLMIQEAQRRAYHGVLEPVFYKGIECAQVRRYSDPLLMFLIKQRDPTYRDGVEDTGVRGQLTLSVNIVNVGEQQSLPLLQGDRGDVVLPLEVVSVDNGTK